MSQKVDLVAMRHSLAHILASAVLELFPDAKFGIGPVVENGFYYDIDIPSKKLTEKDLTSIEQSMRRIIKKDFQFETYDLDIDKAIEWAKSNKQDYKLELLNDLKRSGTTQFKDLNKSELGTIADDKNKIEKVSFYKHGDFIDLCRGPHLNSTGEAGPFKLLRISGAYWRGNENNNQLQRIYGVAFNSKSELEEYLKNYEEAKLRDHRKLGKELDLFVFSDLIGSGLPLFTPRGTVLRDELSRYSNELRLKLGFQKVHIPHITKTDLYEVSGHLAKFGDELFLVKSQETKDKFVLKPMNCPHHIKIYDSKQRSYKDLPIRYLETTEVYRDEKTGELGGLSRVRSITQDDSHIFCLDEQVESEIKHLITAFKEIYKTLNMKISARLSLRDDSKQYLGAMELWEKSQGQLRNALRNNEVEFYEEKGEAAFYGPKIDFMALDSIGRKHQLATVQLDFVMPKRFGLEYDSEKGSKETPVLIHSAFLGSLERFMAIYIEHTYGRFPVWCSPEQLRIITLNQDEEVIKFAKDLKSKALDVNLRASLDLDNESVSKKIRKSELLKIPYLVVVGPKEVETSRLIPRIREDLKRDNKDYSKSISTDEFLNSIVKEYLNRSSKSSL